MSMQRTIKIISLVGLILFSISTSVSAKSSRVEDAQNILTRLGFYAGDIDGNWGKESRKALNDFQEKQGFVVSRGISKAIMDVLKLVDQGAVRGYVPLSEHIGNTLIINTGERIFYDTDGTKIIKLKNGKSVEREWRQMDNGLYCETLYNKKEFCEGTSKGKYLIFKFNDETHWFRRNGRLEWKMSLKEGNQL